MERDIAVYNCDGELLQWIDQKRFQRLVDIGRVARVVKNPHWPRQAHHATAHTGRVEAVTPLGLQGNQVLLPSTPRRWPVLLSVARVGR